MRTSENFLEKLRKAEENSEKLRKDETVAKIDKRLKKSWLKFSSFRQLYNMNESESEHCL